MIIVDFRGLDTLGEVTVLGIAALLVCTLLAELRDRGPARAASAPGTLHAAAPRGTRSLLLEIVGPVLLPLAAVVATWFFVRGHDSPGGGFIGGLTLALGLLVSWLGRGAAWADLHGRLDPWRWIGAGLAIATLAGLASLTVGHPFLTSHYFAGELPLLGGSSLATAMFFDFGVFSTVAGATLLALTTLGRLGAR